MKYALTTIIVILGVVGVATYYNKTEYKAPPQVVEIKTPQEKSAEAWLVAQVAEAEQKLKVEQLRAQLHDEINELLRRQKVTSKRVLDIIAHSGYASSTLEN